MKLKNMNKIHVKNKKEQEWKKYWIVTFCVRCGAIDLGLLPPFPPHVRSLIHLASHQSHRKSNQSREIRENQCQSRENPRPSRETRKNQYWSHQSLAISSQKNQDEVLESLSDQPNQTKRVKWKKTKSPWAASASSSEWRSSWWSWASTWRPALDLLDNDKEATDHKPGAALAAAPCLVHLSWGHLCQVVCSLSEKYWHSFPFEAGQLVGLLQLLPGEGENQAQALKSMLLVCFYWEGCFEVGF